MAKEKIPLYRLSHLAAPAPGPLAAGGLPKAMPGEFMIESFGPYLERQSPHLHHAHRHIFYHMVCFSHGAGSHSIDFLRYPVEAGQIYFMPPGQVHSWSFEGRPEGWVINFSVDFLRAFLLDPGYVDRFTFFSGRAEDSVVRLLSPVREQVYGMLEQMLRQFNGGERAARGGRGRARARPIYPSKAKGTEGRAKQAQRSSKRQLRARMDRNFDADLMRVRLLELLLVVEGTREGGGRG